MNRQAVLMLLVLLLGGCRITTTIVGQGTVTSQSGNFNCSTGNVGACARDYATAGSEVFTAVPAPGWTFAKWTNCNYVSITSCSTSFGQNTAADNWPITATFKLINPPVQAATYTYNALGQRMTKKVGGVTTIFQYDLEGNLIAELNSSGQALRQHIHIGGEPIAQVSTALASGTIAVQYVHTDHLGTPTLLTNQGGSVVADIEAAPFGETYVDYAEVEYNKRFPGQYKDAETGLHYNYFRDYDPSIGRYVQSDRLDSLGRTNDPQLNAQGIYGEGWFNYNGKWYYDGEKRTNHLYGYASQNPNNFIDILGLHHKPNHPTLPGAKHPLGFYVTQPNGNIWSGFRGQDQKCTVPGIGCVMDKAPDLLRRCIKHDQCFWDNDCNYSSWLGNALGAKKSCNQCNSNF